MYHKLNWSINVSYQIESYTLTKECIFVPVEVGLLCNMLQLYPFNSLHLVIVFIYNKSDITLNRTKNGNPSLWMNAFMS